MRDAIGGIFNIQALLVFIVLVSSYLAFSVNYTKAFRMKNKIIDIIEQNEGIDSRGRVNEKVQEYARQIGYTAPRNLSQPVVSGGITFPDCELSLGYCYRRVTVEQKGNEKIAAGVPKEYYEIVTFVNIDLPLIRNIFPNFDMFRVTGSTKTIYKMNIRS